MNPDAQNAETTTAPPDAPDLGPPAEPTNGGLLALLLDPRGLNALMIAGGTLVSLGVIIWLAVIGVFEDPLVVAASMGAGNLALIGAGVGLAAKTRYRTAGRAVAMLGCVLLPLHLWFYDAQGLITLTDGGHLWLPAMACCVIYAGVARQLRDSLFVYAFAAGVAMTGLLFLADGQVDRFWEVVAPSTLLVTLGLGCVHLERAFPSRTQESERAEFTREDFGLAFFRAGHALLASGLGLLFAGRMAGRFYDAAFADLGWFTQPDVSLVWQAKLATLGLTLAGVYGYGYSRLTGPGGRRFTVAGLFCLAWAAVVGFDLAGVAITETLFVGVLGATALACQLLRGVFASDDSKPTETNAALATAGRYAGAVGVGLAVFQMLRGYVLAPEALWGFEFGLGYLVASALLAAAQVVAMLRGGDDELTQTADAQKLALATLTLGSSLAAMVMPTEAWRLVAVAGVPAAWAVASLSNLAEKWRRPLARGAEASAWIAAVVVTPLAQAMMAAPGLVATAALTVAFALLAQATERRRLMVAAGLLGVLAGWQAVVVFQVGVHWPLFLASLGGAVAVALKASGVTGRGDAQGRLVVAASGVAGCLLAGNRLLAGEASFALLALLAGQLVMTGLTVVLTAPRQGRGAVIAVGLCQAAAAALVLNDVSHLDFVQRVELIVTGLGLTLVAAGYGGWWRETRLAKQGADRDHLIDVNLWLGSAAAVAPMSIGLLATRLFGASDVWANVNELGLLAIGLTLFSSGVVCRLRATTLAGGAALAVNVVSLIALIHVPDRLQNVAVYMMVGGGGLFAAAVLLSVFRDRLAALPDRVRQGEGVFTVLKWR